MRGSSCYVAHTKAVLLKWRSIAGAIQQAPFCQQKNVLLPIPKLGTHFLSFFLFFFIVFQTGAGEERKFVHRRFFYIPPSSMYRDCRHSNNTSFKFKHILDIFSNFSFVKLFVVHKK